MTITELLSVCVNSNYFQVKDQFYKQPSDLPMGGVLGPILSNLSIISFEERVFSLNDISYMEPNLWLRFVDDVCFFVGRGNV